MPTPITLAFAGAADTDIANVEALLNDYLGFGKADADGFYEPSEREINLIFPITRNHLSDGLETVLQWAEKADLPYTAVTDNNRSRAVESFLKDAEEVVHAANVTDKVVELLREADGDAEVILLWGDDGSEEAELLLDAAEQAGIKARDLTAGLDDISFGDPEGVEESEPEPEPEPEPQRGRRRGRKADVEAEPKEEPLTEEDTKPEPKPEPEPEPEQPKRRSRRKVEPDPEPEQAAEEESLEQEVSRAAHKAQQQIVSDLENRFGYHPATGVTGPLHTQVRAMFLEFAQALEPILPEGREKSLVLTKVEEAMFWANAAIARSGAPLLVAEAATSAPQEPEEDAEEHPAPRRRRGRPRDESKTVAFLEDEDGNLTKRGRGRIPAGSKVVQLTRAEIEEKGLSLDSE